MMMYINEFYAELYAHNIIWIQKANLSHDYYAVINNTKEVIYFTGLEKEINDMVFYGFECKFNVSQADSITIRSDIDEENTDKYIIVEYSNLEQNSTNDSISLEISETIQNLAEDNVFQMTCNYKIKEVVEKNIINYDCERKNNIKNEGEEFNDYICTLNQKSLETIVENYTVFNCECHKLTPLEENEEKEHKLNNFITNYMVPISSVLNLITEIKITRSYLKRIHNNILNFKIASFIFWGLMFLFSWKFSPTFSKSLFVLNIFVEIIIVLIIKCKSAKERKEIELLSWRQRIEEKQSYEEFIENRIELNND